MIAARILALILWPASMAVTAYMLWQLGMAIGGDAGNTQMALGGIGALVAYSGSLLAAKGWSYRNGFLSGALMAAFGCAMWTAGEASIVLVELNWRHSAVEVKAEAQEQRREHIDALRGKLRKAQAELLNLPPKKDTSAFDAQELRALAEPVKWEGERTTLGAVTKKCTDEKHDLYRKCTKVLEIRTARTEATGDDGSRARLEGEIKDTQDKLAEAPQPTGDFGAANRWFAKNTSLAYEQADTMSTTIMLVLLVFARGAPGVLWELPGKRTPVTPKPQPKAEGVKVNREVIKRDVGEYAPQAVEGPAVAGVKLEPKVEVSDEDVNRLFMGSMSVDMQRPALAWGTPEPVDEAGPSPVVEPSREDVVATFREAALAQDDDAATSSVATATLRPSATVTKLVTPPKVVEKGRGAEVRTWLRETLAENGPTNRQDLVTWGGEKGFSKQQVDRAIDSVGCTKTPAGTGRRDLIVALPKPATGTKKATGTWRRL